MGVLNLLPPDFSQWRYNPPRLGRRLRLLRSDEAPPDGYNPLPDGRLPRSVLEMVLRLLNRDMAVRWRAGVTSTTGVLLFQSGGNDDLSGIHLATGTLYKPLCSTFLCRFRINSVRHVDDRHLAGGVRGLFHLHTMCFVIVTVLFSFISRMLN